MTRPALAAWLALALTVPFLGCLADAPAPLADDPAPGGADAAVRETLHFADGWALGPGEPAAAEPGRAPLGDFYGAWAAGGPFPEWASAPLPEARLVTGAVELEFWVTTRSAVTSTPGIFPDFVLYFGSTESLLADASPRSIRPTAGQDVSVLGPGDVVHVTATLELPPGGLVIPAGAGVRVVTAPVMLETDANDLEVLYGTPEHPSAVRFDAAAVDAAPWETAEAEAETTSHVLAAGSLVAGEREGATVLTVAVDVPEGAAGLLVDLRFTGSTPFPDMDLHVIAPNGTAFARSVTPGPMESVHLYAPNLAAGGPGEWTVKVVNYVTAQAPFDLTVTTLAGATAQ